MKQTTIIVGAGASADFGLPLGRGLAELIYAQLDESFGPHHRDDGALRGALARRVGRGLAQEDVGAALALRDGLIGASTIDHILGQRSHQRPIVEIGKMAIANAILSAEAESPLAFDNHDREAARAGLWRCRDTWLAHLVRTTIGVPSADRFVDALTSVSFVTFNYDRCIEKYFYAYLRYVVGLPPSDAAKALSRIHIHHVFGSLGDGVHESDCKVPFGSAVRLEACGQAIRTFTEPMTHDELRRLYDISRHAEQIVSIGFGFAETNVDKVFGNATVSCPVYCTTKGMRQQAVQRIAHRFDDFRPFDGTGAELFDEFPEIFER